MLRPDWIAKVEVRPVEEALVVTEPAEVQELKRRTGAVEAGVVV